MSIKKQARVVAVCTGASLALALFAYALGLFARSDSSFSSYSPPDLSNHPVYSRYRFGNGDSVLDIGTQPLFLAGVISEVMQRDAILQSVLAERGVEARFHSFLKGADINFFLARGDLEAGIGGDMPTLMACANSAVLVTSLMDQHFASLVARRPMLIPALKGKRIAYAFGSQAHHALLAALAVEGLGPHDVSMIPMDVHSMADALHDGRIDVFAAWEPTPSIAIHKYPKSVRISRTLTTGYLYFSEAFARNSRELIRLVVASQLRAMAWIRANDTNLHRASSWALAAGGEIDGNTDGTPTQVLASAVNEGLLGFSASAFIPEKMMAKNSELFRQFRFLQELGAVPEHTSWKDIRECFDDTLVSEIMAQPDRYRLYVDGFLEDLAGSQ